MQDCILKFLLTLSSSPRKTNNNKPRINRIIHLFLILISDDVIFILKYYPARGSLWKPKTPLKLHPLRQSTSIKWHLCWFQLNRQSLWCWEHIHRATRGQPSWETIGKESSLHSCTCVHQGSTRQTGEAVGSPAHDTALQILTFHIEIQYTR